MAQISLSGEFDLSGARSGDDVLIGGRPVPRLQAFDRGDMIEFVLDRRFSYLAPREWAGVFASAIAQAMVAGPDGSIPTPNA